MPRATTQKDCFRPLDGTRRPICHKFETSLCCLCYHNAVFYETVQEEALLTRKIKNRQSAARSRARQVQKRKDMLAENVALQREENKANLALFELGQTKQRLLAAINEMSHSRALLMEQAASDISICIVMNPEEAIDHLIQTFGGAVQVSETHSVLEGQEEDV